VREGTAPPRYDGLADWYDASYIEAGESAYSREAARLVGALLGAGSGRCLDIGCGTGALVAPLAALGWTVVGVDISADQLRVARERGVDAELLLADAAALPFEDASFDAALASLAHTDVDDYTAALREAARVLRPGGRYAHVGLHPCFAGHFSTVEPEGRLLRPGYFETGLSYKGVEEGVRVRTGAWHLPLADLLNAVVGAGLELERFEESLGDPPMLLGFGARRTQ
jgi:SAM-dependent methyltransferase